MLNRAKRVTLVKSMINEVAICRFCGFLERYAMALIKSFEISLFRAALTQVVVSIL